MILISDIIKERIKVNKASWNANDCIAEFIKDDELCALEDEVEEAFLYVLKSLIIDPEDPNSRDTARRLAKTYIRELMWGRYHNEPDITTFPNQSYEGMLVVRAELISMCAHHHQTMKGRAYIGIIPNGRVMGLSKYIRIAQWIARRGQIQEELTTQIAQTISSVALVEDVGVYVAMTHGCVENRGVGAHSSLTQTTVLYGEFQEPHVKEEFFKNINLQELSTGGR